ncbi:MAG: glycerophosphodiester phosphodiesterase [Spirochaetes bacterium]|nr:glycerophosphodiester phosphodiesterase [Spirochaetota bacterium]MBU1081825.1 glycerophosphodiester phosphodiesterase [Spirochaetota bacterium]
MDKLLPLPERDRPLVFAHRGLSSEAPENTMAAFRLAREKGAPGVELDIHLTADGRLIVIHDHTTNRVGPGTSLTIEDSTTAQIKAVDVGSWMDPRFSGERAPLLSELFEELGDDLYFDIEIKSGKAEDKGLEAAFAKLLADFRYGAERVVVSSFNPIAIKRFKSLCPRVPTGIIYCIDEGVPPYLRRGEGRWIGRADFLKPKYTQATKAGVALGRLVGGRKVIPWTIDDPAEAARVLTIGCEGVISNMPHRLGLPGFANG